MSRLVPVPEPSIIRHPSDTERFRKRRTFTGLVGAACMLPLRAIIDLCVTLRIHPNTLTLIGVIINVPTPASRNAARRSPTAELGPHSETMSINSAGSACAASTLLPRR